MNKFLCLLLFSMSCSCFANSLVCSGTVESIGYTGNNRLMVKLSSMNTMVQFCSPSGNWVVPGVTSVTGESVSPEACHSQFSIFLSAKATNQVLTNVHLEGADVPTDCNSFADWKRVFVREIEL